VEKPGKNFRIAVAQDVGGATVVPSSSLIVEESSKLSTAVHSMVLRKKTL
jgi:hypothetical protein